MGSLQFNIWAVLFIAGAIQGYFLSIVLFSLDQGKKSANICLGLLIFSYSLILTEFIMSISGLFERWPHFIYFSDSLWYLLGPLFYFYIKLLLSVPIKVRLKDVVHVIPAIIMFAINLPFYMLDPEVKLTLIRQAEPSLTSLLVYVLYLVQVPTYLLLSIRMMKNYEDKYKKSESYSSLGHIGWLRTLLLMMIVPVLHDFISFIYQYITNTKVIELNYSVMTFYTILIHSLAYLVIRQPNKIFAALVTLGDKYKTSTLGESERKVHLENLHTLMREEKPFLDPDLKLLNLANMLSISPHHLSQILNQDVGLSFYEFINRHRLKEVKKLLINSEYGNYTLLAIALEVGFNNKTSFNRIFKQQTGVTPSSFVKMQKAAAVKN